MATVSTTDQLPVGQLLRISSDREGLGLGVTRQSQDNHALAAARKWQIVETYEDNDKSAYRGRFSTDGKWISGRPDYDRCLEDLRVGRIRGVVAYHPDRVFGHPRELEDLIDIVESTGAQIATCQTGSYDLSTPAGRLVARQLGAASRYEREMKAERQRRKARELAERGKVGGGGTRPFGFEADRVTVRDSEADLAREAASRVVAGETLRGIVRDWHARGITTVTGKPWTTFTLRRMLLSPRIAGLREHKGRVVGPAEWPAIVDRETWESVRRILTDPSRFKAISPRRYLLAGGLAVCGMPGCGARLVARPKADKRRCYVCASGPGFRGCGKIRMLADECTTRDGQPGGLEVDVVSRVLVALDGPGLADAIRRERERGNGGSNLSAELEKIDAKLANLAAQWADDQLDDQSWAAARQRLEARRDVVTAKLAARSRTSALTVLEGGNGDLPARWEALTFDQQRAVLQVLIERVEVGPAVKGQNFYNPDRVKVIWRA